MRKLINVIQINLIAVFTIMTIIFLFFGNSIYIIQGGSMNPTFFQGDIVFTIKNNRRKNKSGPGEIRTRNICLARAAFYH